MIDKNKNESQKSLPRRNKKPRKRNKTKKKKTNQEPWIIAPVAVQTRQPHPSQCIVPPSHTSVNNEPPWIQEGVASVDHGGMKRSQYVIPKLPLVGEKDELVT